jgi:hypothetical protein
MRRLLRTALALVLAAAPATVARANPFDGAENTGADCNAVLTQSGGTYLGVLTGGPYVVADLVANNNGALGVDSHPGPATQVWMRCQIRRYSTGSPYVDNTAGPWTGVAVFVPEAFAFTSPYTQFLLCTSFTWQDNTGATVTADHGCTALPVT